MGLFSKKPPAANPAQIQQLKTWVIEVLGLDPSVPISISQLQCTEPGCPPLETVIAVMTHPPQTYKIHRPLAEIDHHQVMTAIGDRS